MNPTTEPGPPAAGKKPRLALLLATGFGLGYLPVAPGTWGSLAGVALAWWSTNLCALLLRRAGWLVSSLFQRVASLGLSLQGTAIVLSFLPSVIVMAGVALLGVWAAGRAARHLGSKDPQVVVIDEVSGQHLTLLVGVGWSVARSWKYLLLGFILFRVFDIWKPFPARQAERLRGGWGIMADDWVAGLYAALGLWLARALGL